MSETQIRPSATAELVRLSQERATLEKRLSAWKHVATELYDSANGCGVNCDCYPCNLYRFETEKDARLNAGTD